MNIRTDKRGYEKLASAIRAGFKYASDGAGNFDKRYKAQAVAVVAEEIAKVLAESDPTFVAEYFYSACQFDPNTKWYYSHKELAWVAYGDIPVPQPDKD